MLSGDNGILQRATDAKIKTERQSVVEQARTDVLGYQVENKGTDLQKNQLKSVLDTYFKSVPDLTDMSESEILNTQLQTLDKYGNHSIAIKEIFDGILSENNQTKTATTDEINAKIGTVVTGYSAENLEWQVYYADENETFLISKNIALEKDLEYSLKGNETGSSAVRNSIYGTKWNSKWLEKCSTESTSRNAKATEYLCDSANWATYATGSASYAAGGPTLELLIASWNASQKTNIDLSSNSITNKGYYNTGFLMGADDVKARSNGVYLFDSGYWIASPNNEEDEDNSVYAGDCLITIDGYMGNTDVSESWGIRPIVSIPTSKISINGDTVTILP